MKPPGFYKIILYYLLICTPVVKKDGFIGLNPVFNKKLLSRMIEKN
jgi:hypothetical protein